jgi:hypothetical protein
MSIVNYKNNSRKEIKLKMRLINPRRMARTLLLDHQMMMNST